MRRDTQSRARLAQSWFRKDNGDAEEDKPADWRRGGRNREWERDRNTRFEAEPEWMDSIEPEEPFQARTQEDFQRWKEKMKAGGAAPLEKIETAIASPPPEEKHTAKHIVSPEPDDSMDRFFARYEKKEPEQKVNSLKAHGKTRFASLFSPATEQNKQVDFPAQTPSVERPVSVDVPGPSTDADQAGFARILEMLQTRSNNPTPQSQEAPKARTPLYARGSEQKTEPEAKPQNALFTIPSAESKANQQLSEQHLPSALQQRHIDTRSPVEQHTHQRQQSSINKDEVLLNLLRQASLAPKPQPPPPAGSGMFSPGPDQNNRPPTSRQTMTSPNQAEQNAFRRELRGSGYDELPISLYPGEQAPREHPARRPTNSTQPGYTENDLITLLRGQDPRQRPQQPPQQVSQGYPPGLQRPPGFDQMQRPNPSWQTQQPQPPQQQQQPPRQPSLPPGLASLPRGIVVAPPYGQPQQIPIQQHQQQQRTQQPPSQRKYTAESSMPPNLPPGMYPSQGFMNAGPPPGFPGAMANHPAARFGGEPGLQQRAYLEMYGDIGGRGLGLRGGGGGNARMPPHR